MSFSVRFGNFLFRYFYALYKPLYAVFKRRQDRAEIALLKKYIHTGDNVIDIGANIGFYASILSELAGEKGSVHCFEPDALNYQRLLKTTSARPNVHTYNVAVGAESGELKLYLSGELNVDHRTYASDNYTSVTTVKCIALDDMFEDKKVDFIKMDIQGFETHALKGMDKVLKSNPHINVVSEFWPYGLRHAGSSCTDYFEALERLGFTCYLVGEHSLQKLTREKVRSMQDEPKEKFYNILATRNRV
jgi:FkbM family methyltransferase